MVGETISHYRVLSSLGKGGMGVVYEAEDTRLHRRVALKFLPEESASPKALERFRREAQAASALNHPNICVIHDIGEHEGRPFIVMEKLEGMTLRELLAHGRLSVTQILELGAQIADALATAHEAGIVHRDIKPTNVFVTRRGDAKLLDFGLAKLESSIDDADPDASTRAMPEQLTASGTTVGTVGYMSPEQARGEPLDARSDLFSLGTVLWEMTTGRTAFNGSADAMIFDAILHRELPPPSSLNPEAPTALDQVILGALEKEKDLRVQSAAELRAQLRRLIRDSGSGENAAATPAGGEAPPKMSRRGLSIALAVAGIVAIVAVVWFVVAHRGAAVSPAKPKPTSARTKPAVAETPSIAVLPFANVSADKNQEYFADGLTDELTDVLAKVPRLRVIGRTSSFQFKGKSEDLRVIGRKLGVNHILEGSVSKAGDRVRINAELVNSKDGSEIWSDSFDRTLDDVFKVQNEIAQAVAKAMQVKLLGGLPRRSTTTSPEAHNLALQARFFYNLRTEDGYTKAAENYERATRIDPSYAAAWAGLSLTYDRQASGSYIPNSGFEKARNAARNAIAADPNLALGHVALAAVYRNWDWNWASAEKELSKALELDPHNSDALVSMGSLAWVRGQFDEAIRYDKAAIRSDPLRVAAYGDLALAQWSRGRYSEGEATTRKVLSLSPSYWSVHNVMGRMLIGEGKLDAALAEMQKEPPDGARENGLAIVYWALGRKAESDAEIAKLEKLKGNWATLIAECYAFRGDRDHAFQWIDLACREHDPIVVQIKGSRYFNSLHGDPRWKTILEKLKIPVS